MFQRRKVGFCRWPVVLLGLTAFSAARAARAAETALEPIRLSYLAPDACPSFDQFLSEVQRSSARVRLAGPGEAARRFDVQIAQSGLTGQLTLGGGQGGERAASGDSCRAVAALLAFAVALAADPEAQPAELTRGVAAFPALHPAPPTTLKPTPTPAPVAPPSRAPVPVAPAAGLGPRLQWGAAAVGFVTGASSPPPTFGGGAVAELQLSAVSWAPRFRLGANYAKKTFARDPGQVALTMAFLSFEFCSGALHRGGFTFLPCLRAQGGTRNAEGLFPVPGYRSELRGFFELGAAGHVRFRFAGPAFIELGAALLFPTVRDRVFIRPELEYEVPTAGVLGECALGVELGDQTAD